MAMNAVTIHEEGQYEPAGDAGSPGRSSLVALAMIAALFGGLLAAPHSPGLTNRAASALADPAMFGDSGPPPFEAMGRTTETSVAALVPGGIVVIDLDTARSRRIDIAEWTQVEAPRAGRALLWHSNTLYASAGQRAWAVDLPDKVARDLGPGAGLGSSTTPGRIWVLEPPTEQTRQWREVAASGESRGHMQWPVGAGPSTDTSGTPETVAIEGDGFATLNGDSTWSLVAAGEPITANESAALVRRCSSAPCAYVWVDLETGDQLARDLPPGIQQAGDRIYRLSPSGAHVLEARIDAGGFAAVHVYGDGTVRNTACGAGWERPAWSVDEELLACADGTSVTVTDLVAGTVAVFELDETPAGVAVVPSEAFDEP